MTRRKANADSKQKQRLIASYASPDVMLGASSRASSSDRAKAYFYGNLGDSIERRYTGDGYGLLGEGHDGYNGVFGPNSSWQSQGFGNYFGTGLLNGNGRMFSGVHSGLGGGGFTYLRRFSANSSFNHALIAQCMLAYLGYGVVRNIVDLYADFATEGIEIDHPDKTVRNFYRTWATKIGLRERAHSLFVNLFTSANVFIHRRWASLSESEKRAMKRAEAARLINDTLVVRGRVRDSSVQGREASFIDWFLNKNNEIHLTDDKKNQRTVAASPKPPIEEDLPDNQKKLIPWGYTFLNPLQMELRGRRLRGDHYWVMAIDKRDTLDIAKGMGMYSSFNQELGTTEINLPKEFLNRIQSYSGPGVGYSAEVKLNKEELTVVQAPGKWDWFDWAIPFVFPALKSLSFKDCLRNMEMKACQSVINSIFLFKLGDMAKGMPAEDEHFERLADMLQMPGQSLNILWNEAISAEVIQADVNGIFSIDKHQSADKDILTALGIPEVLIGGTGGNFSNSFIAVSTVLERLESYRGKVEDWLMGELKVIADAMGFQKLPTIKFGRTSLTDEKSFQAFLTGLYDRNILSADTLLREANTDTATEVSKLKEEKELREKDIFEPRGPFVKEPKPAPGATPGASPSENPKTANGRPPGSSTGPTGPQENPRPPQGQNVIGALLDLQDVLHRRGRSMLEQVEQFVSTRVLRAMAKENPNLKHMKQLRAEERERLEWLIYNVFSHMPVPDRPDNDSPVSDEFIIHILRSDACEKVKADVFNIYTDKVAEYSKTYGKTPTREMRRQFMVSAWTQRAIMEHVATKPELLRT